MENSLEETRVNSVSINTRHFISTVDAKNQTYTVFGDFTETEIMKLDNPCLINNLIEELSNLQRMLRKIARLEDKV